jgi:predicted transcriptional regulator
MKTVTLQVATRQDVNRRTLEAFRGKKQGSRISFETPELLFRLMTAKRWALIRTITGAGPLTIQEIARRVHRDVKPKIRDGLLDEATAWEEWYFQPIW